MPCYHEWNTQELLVQAIAVSESVVVAKRFAMIGDHDQERALGKPQAIDGISNLPQVAIDDAQRA
jgi:hypothetical protein